MVKYIRTITDTLVRKITSTIVCRALSIFLNYHTTSIFAYSVYGFDIQIITATLVYSTVRYIQIFTNALVYDSEYSNYHKYNCLQCVFDVFEPSQVYLFSVYGFDIQTLYHTCLISLIMYVRTITRAILYSMI